MSRPKPTLASRPRQPQTKPRSCGIQPAHESLFNRRLRILSPAVRTPELTPSAPADTNNRARTLESEHESRLLKNVFEGCIRGTLICHRPPQRTIDLRLHLCEFFVACYDSSSDFSTAC